jgi:hypothetical protein
MSLSLTYHHSYLMSDLMFHRWSTLIITFSAKVADVQVTAIVAVAGQSCQCP